MVYRQAHSGYEKKVAQAIRDGAEKEELESLIEDGLYLLRRLSLLLRVRRKHLNANSSLDIFLVKMIMTDGTYHLIKDMTKVSGFLGTGR